MTRIEVLDQIRRSQTIHNASIRAELSDLACNKMSVLRQSTRDGEDSVISFLRFGQASNEIKSDILLTLFWNRQRFEESIFLFTRCFTPSTGIIVVNKAINIRYYSFLGKGLACKKDCLALSRVAGG